ncbi:MAG: hypothetical protein JWM23_541 [Microbacteriaceae bacterium]|nr:hypothetical protein [Microbacteriaceae bacterium]
MSDSGPTTAGSIVAKLRMDRDVWIADMSKTKADAREIGSLHPTVKVDVDTAGALAKLEALRIAAERAGAVGPSASTAGPSGPSAGTAAKVDAVAAAERRLAAAVSAADTAFARAELAQMRLNEVRDKGVTEGSRLAAAELAAAEAVKRLDAANERATLSEGALAASQEKAARAALEKAAAEEVATRATVKANEANSTNVSRVGMITTAVGLLLPLMVPVAAGAIGIAGALGMMGVAGIFAVVGIKKQMEQGTAAGLAYTAGIGSLKTNMASLAGTTAVAMLSSFQRIVRETNDDMPMLNRQIGLYSGLLGRSGANLFSGSLNTLRVLEPLLMSAGIYVERLTQKFDAWTSNGGLERFGSYALGVLPKVEEVLGALASAVMHILEALAPLGSIGMDVLSAVSNGIGGIPVDVLSNLIGAITWGAIAFKSWGFIAPMLSGVATSMGAVGAATTIATGPIGWIVAGVAALAAVFAIASANAEANAKATSSYAAGLQQDGNVIGAATRAQAAKNLQDSQAFALAKQLGISYKTVTDATLGNASAIQKVKDATDKANAANAELHKGGIVLGADNQKRAADALQNANAGERLNGIISIQSGALRGQIGINKELQAGISGTTAATKEQDAATAAMAAAAGVSVEAYKAALGAQTDTKGLLEKTTAAMFLQNDAAGLLKQSLDLLNGKTLGAAQAQNQFDSQIANMSTHINAAGKEINRADTELEGMTASAVKNRGELLGLTDAAFANAQAFRDNGGSADEAKQKLIAMKEQIIANAVAHGEDEAKVRAYIDTVYQIPASIPPTKIEVDTATALRQVDLFVANVNSRVATIQVRSALPDLNGDVSGSGRMGTAANGGTIGHLAGGGSGTVRGPGTADSDTAGLFHLANGEEVTSNKFGQADRYRGLLKQINAGVVPSTASHAAVKSKDAGQSGPTVVHQHSWKIFTNDPEALFQGFQNRTNMLGAV